MIKRLYFKIIEILYTIHLSRQLETLIYKQGLLPFEAIEQINSRKLSNKYVTPYQAECAIRNLKRYVYLTP